MDETEGSYEQSCDGRRSALPERIEVRARPKRWRRWSSAAKLAIIRETLAAGSTAQAVADRHGIGTGLIYTWRKQMLRAAMAGFAAVEIKPDVPAALPGPVQDTVSAPFSPPVVASSAMPGGIEVELPSRVRLRYRLDVDVKPHRGSPREWPIGESVSDSGPPGGRSAQS
jgi:transposase